MIVSMKWLTSLVPLAEQDIKQFAENMTMFGNKVESIHKLGQEISGVVVGKIIAITPHEKADKLVVCQLDVGKETPLQIVTGATNVYVGALVPVAADGAVLVGGNKIVAKPLREVKSEGMLCSLSEIGLTKQDFPTAAEDGIFLLDQLSEQELQESVKLGDDVFAALMYDDVCIEFEVTANRPDCLSMMGIAREVAACYDVPFDIAAPQVSGCGGNIHEILSVDLTQPDLCSRYCAKVIQNVKIAPSPVWMQRRLRACGVQSINNLVDITNYVMLEYGQPLHAFDARQVSGNQICVRTAKPGETITTLDGNERVLTSEMLVIADVHKALAVAGVMGGEHSGIQSDTTTVILESACFARSSIRATAKALGMRTESSSRYEKGLSPKQAQLCTERACELIEQLGAGEVVDGIIDLYPAPQPQKTIDFDANFINTFLGLSLADADMREMLEKLYLPIENEKLIVPYFREDMEGMADVAEEVARKYGYQNIPTTAPKGLARGRVSRRQKFERIVGQTMRAMGCYEVLTYSFISPKHYQDMGLDAVQSVKKSVAIANPLGDTTSIMRNTMLPTMLEVLARNYNNRIPECFVYEIGKEYHPVLEAELPDERDVLCIGMYGKSGSMGAVDFYTLKGMIETLLRALGIVNATYRGELNNLSFHPGRTAGISLGDTYLGILGEVAPQVSEQFGLDTKGYVAMLKLDALYTMWKEDVTFKALPKFPAMQRDLSLVCERAVPVGVIEQTIIDAGGPCLEQVTLFDVYEGQQIAQGQKSVSYALTLRSKAGTLTDLQADDTVKTILEALAPLEVTLRQ